MIISPELQNEIRENISVWKEAVAHSMLNAGKNDVKWTAALGLISKIEAELTLEPRFPVTETSPVLAEAEKLIHSCQHKIREMKAYGFNSDHVYFLSTVTPAEQAMFALSEFHDEATHYDLLSYIEHDNAILTGQSGVKAAQVVRNLAKTFRDADPELADLVSKMAYRVMSNLELVHKDPPEQERTVAKEFTLLEQQYRTMDKERCFEFFLNVANGLSPEVQPFTAIVVKEELSSAPTL